MKRKKGESRKRNPVRGRTIFSVLVPSLLTLILCLAAFGGATYAWFSDNETSGDRTFVVNAPEVTAVAMYVKAPKLELSDTEEVNDSAEDAEDSELSREEKLLEKENEKLAALQGVSTDDWIREEKADPLTGEFSLKADTPYVMRFAYEDTGAEGQPEECFLLLKIGEKKYYTPQIELGKQLKLLLKPSASERGLRYTAIPGKSEDQILDGFTRWESSEEEDPMAVLQEKIDIRMQALELEIEQAELKLQEQAEAVMSLTRGMEANAENDPAVMPEAEAEVVTETETETAASETENMPEAMTAAEAETETETAAASETEPEGEAVTAAEAETENETVIEAETAAAAETGSEAPSAGDTEEPEQQTE